MTSLIFSESAPAQPPKPPPTIRRASSFSKLLPRGSNGFTTDYPLQHNQNDYVTVVQVEEDAIQASDENSTKTDEFVTVLEIGAPESDVTGTKLEGSRLLPFMEEITLFRLPGEKLGMALKFEGGGSTSETIERVLIQNISSDSPASKIVGKILGQLQEGDEILQIDGKQVSKMTRLECVAALRDAPVCIKLLVKRTELVMMHNNNNTTTNNNNNHNYSAHKRTFKSETKENVLFGKNCLRKGPPPPIPPRMSSTSLTIFSTKINGAESEPGECLDKLPPKRRPSQPPPLPPRKPKEEPWSDSESESSPNLSGGPRIGDRSTNEVSENKWNSELCPKKVLADEADCELERNKENPADKVSPETESHVFPIQAESYLDSLTERETTLIESESDDTGSSVSTVIERFSRGSTANSSFSDNFNNLKNGKLDIEKVIGPFEQLEREFDQTEALQKFVSKTAAFMDKHEGPSSMGYDVNLDDYDDIQSVSMHFEISSYTETIVEPPLSFSNSAPDGAKVNGTKSGAQSKSVNPKKESKSNCTEPAKATSTLGCSKVNEAGESLRNGGPTSVTSAACFNDALHNSHETHRRVQLLSSNSTRLENTGKSSTSSQKSDSQEIAQSAARVSNYCKRTPDNIGSSSPTSGALQKKLPDKRVRTISSAKTDCKAKDLDSAPESELNSTEFGPKKVDSDDGATGDKLRTSVSRRVNTAKTNDKIEQRADSFSVTSCSSRSSSDGVDSGRFSEKMSSSSTLGGYLHTEDGKLKNLVDLNATNTSTAAATAATLEESCSHSDLEEPELFLTDSYPIPYFKELNDDLLGTFKPTDPSDLEENQGKSQMQHAKENNSSTTSAFGAAYKTGSNCNRIPSLLCPVGYSRISDKIPVLKAKINEPSNKFDYENLSSLDDEPRSHQPRRGSLPKLPPKGSSLIPKLESNRTIPPPISPRKSKSTLSLTDIEPSPSRPSLIPRAILKPTNKMRPEVSIRRAKSIENVRGFGLKPILKTKKEKCVKFSDIVDVETYKENFDCHDQFDDRANSEGSGMAFISVESTKNSSELSEKLITDSQDVPRHPSGFSEQSAEKAVDDATITSIFGAETAAASVSRDNFETVTTTDSMLADSNCATGLASSQTEIKCVDEKATSNNGNSSNSNSNSSSSSSHNRMQESDPTKKAKNYNDQVDFKMNSNEVEQVAQISVCTEDEDSPHGNLSGFLSPPFPTIPEEQEEFTSSLPSLDSNCRQAIKVQESEVEDKLDAISRGADLSEEEEIGEKEQVIITQFSCNDHQTGSKSNDGKICKEHQTEPDDDVNQEVIQTNIDQATIGGVMSSRSSSSSSLVEKQLTSSSSTISPFPGSELDSPTNYSGHLQPPYRRYTSYDPLISSTGGGVLLLKSSSNGNSTATGNLASTAVSASSPAAPASTAAAGGGVGVGGGGGGLPSSLETRKQNASKLKGLVIPDLPTSVLQPSLSKTLPTIVSKTSSSTDLFLSKPEEAETLTRKSSLPDSRSLSGSGSGGKKVSAAGPSSAILSEPPWVSPKSVVPKYSPAFKRRALELPRSSSVSSSSSATTTSSSFSSFSSSSTRASSSSSVTNSNSGADHHSKPTTSTPTTPLSPSSSHSSNSNNNSSSSSSCVTSSISTKLDGLFQFSLTHSKPITPLLPETASLRPSSSKDEKRIGIGADSCLDRKRGTDFNLVTTSSSSPTATSGGVGVGGSSSSSSGCAAFTSDFNLERREPLSAHFDETDNQINLICSQMSEKKEGLMEEANHHSLVKKSSADNEKKPQVVSIKSELFVNVNCEDESVSRGEVIANREVVPSNSCLDKDQDVYKGALLSPDNSDDESSLLSHKTSDGFSNKADDSAYDTLSDSFERTLSPEIRRPKELSLQRTVLRNSCTSDVTSESKSSESVKHFKALAEKWEKRVSSSSTSSSSVDQSKVVLSHANGKKPLTASPAGAGAPPLPPKPKDATRIPPSFQPRNSKVLQEVSQHDASIGIKYDREKKEQLPYIKPVQEPKKIDTSLWESSIKKERGASGAWDEAVPTKKKYDSATTNLVPSKPPAPPIGQASRSMSVSDICRVFEVLTNVQSATSTTSISSSQTQNGKETLSSPPPEERVVEASRVDDVEEEEEVVPEVISNTDKLDEPEKKVESVHHRMSSLDSTNSDSGTQSGFFDYGSGVGSRTSSVSNLRDSQYGSITSLASTTSLISPQELQHLIDEANQSLEGELSGQNAHNIQVVVLHREYKTSGSIGITLAGGVDYETKEITVHKVITGSLADRDGRIKKGDRILSINGKIVKGVTHREALNILKAPRPEVVIVLSRANNSSDGNLSNGYSRCNSVDSIDQRRSDCLSSRSKSEDTLISSSESSDNFYTGDSYKIYKAPLIKDGAGLGFILEGGKDSPLGDKPLAIKRVFKGGPADKEGTLMSGDELLTVNDQSVRNMTRTEAWNHLKKLPDGEVVIVIRRKIYSCFT